MIEHIARIVYYFGVHLFYASLVWFAAFILTAIIRGSATTKYWIWTATSLNFVLPAGALLDKAFASHLSGARPLSFIGAFGLAVAQNTVLIGSAWALGALLMAVRLWRRLQAEHCEAKEGSWSGHDTFAEGVPVGFAGGQFPAVHGLLRSRISLPTGIDQVLTHQELNAVLLHEVTHAKRHDNLIWLVHEVCLCLLWFHPLMWITGSRMALYRELSCDEHVIHSDHGSDLISALAKLTDPERIFLLKASASSFISYRLARLAEPSPARTQNGLMIALFVIAGVAGVYATVAHTACCFILKH